MSQNESKYDLSKVVNVLLVMQFVALFWAVMVTLELGKTRERLDANERFLDAQNKGFQAQATYIRSLVAMVNAHAIELCVLKGGIVRDPEEEGGYVRCIVPQVIPDKKLAALTAPKTARPSRCGFFVFLTFSPSAGKLFCGYVCKKNRH